MALQSIEKKRSEIQRANAQRMQSEGKATLIRVRTGLLVGGVAMFAAEVGCAALGANTGTLYFFGIFGALMICGWVVLLFAGMFVS